MAGTKTSPRKDEPFGLLPPFRDLDEGRRGFLTTYYKECGAMWRHWTRTIWSIPSIASAINLTIYGAFFGVDWDLPASARPILLFILTSLNGVLTLGLWRHRGAQNAYGKRLREVEAYAGIPEIPPHPRQRGIHASAVYVALMITLSLISLAFLFHEYHCWLFATFGEG